MPPFKIDKNWDKDKVERFFWLAAVAFPISISDYNVVLSMYCVDILYENMYLMMQMYLSPHLA